MDKFCGASCDKRPIITLDFVFRLCYIIPFRVFGYKYARVTKNQSLAHFINCNMLQRGDTKENEMGFFSRRDDEDDNDQGEDNNNQGNNNNNQNGDNCFCQCRCKCPCKGLDDETLHFIKCLKEAVESLCRCTKSQS